MARKEVIMAVLATIFLYQLLTGVSSKLLDDISMSIANSLDSRIQWDETFIGE